MSDEIKPVRCGCGGEAFHDTARGWNPVREDALVVWHRVICKNCGTQTKAFYTEAEAVEAWNKAMGEDKVGELMEHIWRDKLDTREKIANLVERMLR